MCVCVIALWVDVYTVIYLLGGVRSYTCDLFLFNIFVSSRSSALKITIGGGDFSFQIVNLKQKKGLYFVANDSIS